MATRRLRVAAYAVCFKGDRLLLARYVSPGGAKRHWTLPGGKVEHAEDPYDAVVREVAEETGYHVEVEKLLGVDSRSPKISGGLRGSVEQHNVGIFYRVRIVGGELRNETGGSTDLADWIPLERVSTLERAVMVDTALRLHNTLPASGHVDPVPVSGLLRH